MLPLWYCHPDCGHLPGGIAGTRQVQKSKTMTPGRRETTGYNEKVYSNCFGDENILPTAVSTLILMQNWSISPRYVLTGMYTSRCFTNSNSGLPGKPQDISMFSNTGFVGHFSKRVSPTSFLMNSCYHNRDSWEPHQSCEPLVHEVL